MKLENKLLGDFLTLKRGYDLPALQRAHGSIPVVSSSGITGFHNSAKVEGPGVVTGRYGTLGEVFYVNENFWPLNTALYVKDFKGNDRRYTAYFLKNLLKGISSDKAAVPGVNRNDLHARKIKVVTDTNLQQDIVVILSAYDDLIENNKRRIQLLEQSARLLYKEWFANFRFPGHEHVKIRDGVPEGWEQRPASDAMTILSGGTPKTNVAEYWDGGIPFFTPKDASDQIYVKKTEKSISELGLKQCSSQLFLKDTVFITARGTVGNFNLSQTDMAMNQSCYALIAKPPITQYFLYFALSESVEQFKSRAVGAVFDAIVKDTFRLIPFVVPNKQLIILFENHVSKIIRQAEVLIDQTRNLEAARDLLLPRLMSGR